MTEDHQLLRQFAEHGSEAAFARLVAIHLDLVHSAAQRQLHDTDQARDVAQLVFTDLARKARSLPPGLVLAAWLHRATRHAARQVLRAERRRRQREQQAMDLNSPHSPCPDSLWSTVMPVLDEALDRLPRRDREALLLRFFGPKDLRGVGQALGVSEDAAQKRVSRALERLREQLSRRGITSTAGALAAGLAGHAVSGAPSGLAASVAAFALAGASSGSLASFLVLMSAMKLKIAGGVAAAVLLTSLVWQQREIQTLREETARLRLAASRPEPELPTESPAPEELRRQAEERMELLRLRGEVARLRRELRELPLAVQSTEPSPAASMAPLPWGKFEGNIPRGGALVTGGWVTTPGRRGLLLLSPEPSSSEEGAKVKLSVRFAEVAEDVLARYGLDLQPTAQSDDSRFVLDADRSSELITQLEAEEGVEFANPVEAITDDQKPHYLAWTSDTYEGSISAEVVPTIQGEDGNIRLAINLEERPATKTKTSNTPP